MKVKVGDYVIFVTTNKPQLGVISSIDPLRVQLEPDEKLKRPIVDIQADNIQAVLGAKTISGTAFGIDVANRYVDLVENGNFGDLALYGYGIKQHLLIVANILIGTGMSFGLRFHATHSHQNTKGNQFTLFDI